MPVRLRGAGSPDIVLDSHKLSLVEEGSYFSLTNGDGLQARVNYMPSEASSWDAGRFELWVCQNPYLNAENDVFEVYLKESNDERAGWMFPIRLLDANDSDSIGKGNFNRYRSLAYTKLFDADLPPIVQFAPDRLYGMSELFGEVTVLLLSRDVLDALPDFDIGDYRLSLYQYGYVMCDGARIIEPKHGGTLIRDEMRARKRLNIRRAAYSLDEDLFTKALVEDTLLQTREAAVRFILLYQVLEHLMAKTSHQHFLTILEKYKASELTKNDFRERLFDNMKEREILGRLFEGWGVETEMRNTFADECEGLLVGRGTLKTRDLHNCIYDVRNLLTHNLRLAFDAKDETARVVERFERILMQFLVESVVT